MPVGENFELCDPSEYATPDELTGEVTPDEPTGLEERVASNESETAETEVLSQTWRNDKEREAKRAKNLDLKNNKRYRHERVNGWDDATNRRMFSRSRLHDQTNLGPHVDED